MAAAIAIPRRSWPRARSSSASTQWPGWRRWTFPAVVVGQNPIAAYVMIHLFAQWVVDALHRHFGAWPFTWLGPEFQPLLENLSVGAIVWLICYWMYRRQIFLRL